MASVYVIEIDGWGEVGPAMGISVAQGYADGTFKLTTATTPPGTDEFGAMIWVEGCDAVIADGYYTLIARTASTLTMQAKPEDVTVTTASGISGLARIEDHYKLSDSLPSWVTGANAQARWYRDLTEVSHSAGQRIDRLGGVATVDQWSFRSASPRRGLLACAPLSYRSASVGPVTVAAAMTSTATAISTYSAAPYSGESATSPTGPAQPILIGTEAIDVRGTASPSSSGGATAYTVTHDGSSNFVVRGVLRTEAHGHTEAEYVFGSLPTPIGQVIRSFVYAYGHESHADRSQVSVGVGESVSAIDYGNVVQVNVASSVIDPNRKVVGGIYGGADTAYAEASGIDIADTMTWQIDIRQHSDSQWSWVTDVNGHAAIRVTWADELIAVESDGTRVYRYTAQTWPLTDATDFPIIRPAMPATYATIASSHWRRRYLQLSPDAWQRAEHRLCHVFEPVNWSYLAGDLGEFPGTITINPVDVILQVLMSTGTPGLNGVYDTAPAEVGMGIPAAQIDMDSFTTIGDRLYSRFIAAITVFIDEQSSGTLKEWLSALCRGYSLAIVTTQSGLLRLVDMVEEEQTGAKTLTVSDIIGPVRVSYDISPGTSVSSISTTFPTPFVRPAIEDSSGDDLIVESSPGSAFVDGILIEDKIEPHTDIYNQQEGGTLSLLRRIGSGSSAKVETEFALYKNHSQRDALRQRFTRILTQNAGVGARFSVDVDPDFDAVIGDVLKVTIDELPDPQNSGAGMSAAYCRVEDRIHEYRPTGRNPRDTITLRVFGTSDPTPLSWSPSGQVSSVTSATDFDLVANEFKSAADTSDAETFADGAKVHIYDQNLVLRSTVSAGTVNTASGNNLTLSAAATNGGGPVTPSVGDIVLYAPVSDQSASVAAGYASISQNTPGDLWS